MVDMGDDGKIADMGNGRCHGARFSRGGFARQAAAGA
jgi:hypothetical protein